MNVIYKAILEGHFLSSIRKEIWRRIKKLESLIDLFFALTIGTILRKKISKDTKVVNNRILIFTFQFSYTCNPKYIYEELEKLKDFEKYEIYWAVNTKKQLSNNNLPDYVIPVQWNTYDYYKIWSSSKVIICNTSGHIARYIPKKENQIFIETWHGSMGIKRFDETSNKDKRFLYSSKVCGRQTDFCLSNCTWETKEVFRDTFWHYPHTKVLEIGHPRNDILFSNKGEELYKEFIEEYEIKDGTKFILYAPTFRDAKSLMLGEINTRVLIEEVEKKFSGKWKLLIKFHPRMKSYAITREMKVNKNVINVSNYPDIQELMIFCDIAITDYSSWIYDFVVMKRKGFIFAPDYNLYKNERVLYFPLEETPFSVCYSMNELVDKIRRFDIDSYSKKIDIFLERMGCIEDGKASIRGAKLVEFIMNNDVEYIKSLDDNFYKKLLYIKGE